MQQDQDFANIVPDGVVKEALDKAEKEEIERLKGKEGKKLLSFGLTAREFQAMKWMSRAMEGKTLKSHQLQFVQEFIKYSIGNMDLNKRLKSLVSNGDLFSERGSKMRLVSSSLYLFTFNSKELDKFHSLISKFEKIWNRINNNMKYTSDYQLTLLEFGIINQIIKNEQFFILLKSSKLLTGDQDLTILHDKVIKLSNSLKEVNDNIKDEITFKSGDLVLYESSKFYGVLNKILSLKDKIISLFTNYGHAGKIIVNNNQNSITHLYPVPRAETFKSISYLYSDIYRINIQKLISPKFSYQLEKKYSDFKENWYKKVDELYRNIEKEISENIEDRFSHVDAGNKNLQYLAGLADYIPMGHRRSKDRDFNKVADKVLNGFYKDNDSQMLCSTFVAKTTIASLVQLDRVLKKELGIDDPNVHIIEMPFDKREKLKRISPHRLVKILQEKGCLEKLERTPIEKKLFRASKSDIER